jgi:hypothetical protein
MKLVKVKTVPHLIPGPPGKDGKDGLVKTEVVERLVGLEEFQKQVAALQKQFDWLKNRRAEVIQGGGQAVTKYLFTESQESHWRKPSFVEGINVIGVRYSGAATVYLPHDLEPTMIVSVKDEAGSGNVTVLVE